MRLAENHSARSHAHGRRQRPFFSRKKIGSLRRIPLSKFLLSSHFSRDYHNYSPVPWYNHEHRHSRIGLHTPASVHYGTAHDIRAARQATLDAARLAHPERFNCRPTAPRLPQRVTINDPAKRTPQPQKA